MDIFVVVRLSGNTIFSRNELLIEFLTQSHYIVSIIIRKIFVHIKIKRKQSTNILPIYTSVEVLNKTM